MLQSKIFFVLINGSANIFCDNEDVYKNTITPYYVLNKRTIIMFTSISEERKGLLILSGFLSR